MKNYNKNIIHTPVFAPFRVGTNKNKVNNRIPHFVRNDCRSSVDMDSSGGETAATIPLFTNPGHSEEVQRLRKLTQQLGTKIL